MRDDALNGFRLVFSGHVGVVFEVVLVSEKVGAGNGERGADKRRLHGLNQGKFPGTFSLLTTHCSLLTAHYTHVLRA